MIIENNRRELFEAWMGAQGLQSEWEPMRNCYKDFPAHFAWQAFNAALDAVVIQLPTVDRPSHAGTEWIQVAAQDEYKHRVTAAIESTGLGLKVK